MGKNKLAPFGGRTFHKLQALGNAYIVLDSSEWPEEELNAPEASQWIAQLCSKEWGIGSDGVLWGPSPDSAYRLRIFNTDGSEAEKSGNGIRIFSRYLRDRRSAEARFALQTLGGLVQVEDLGAEGIRVQMGQGRVLGEAAELENFNFSGRAFRGLRIDMGNPHCVLFEGHEDTEAFAKEWGSLIERDSIFPNRSNVQFARVKDSKTLEIFIWERGSAYTLASGSSSCAAAYAAYRLGYVDRALRVEMPGGSISIEIGQKDQIWLQGAVEWIAEGRLH